MNLFDFNSHYVVERRQTGCLHMQLLLKEKKMNTKSDSIMMLVKDVVLGIICGCLFVAFCNEVSGPGVTYLNFWIGLGVPAGWHLLSKIVPVTFSIYGLVIKFALSFLAGIIAFPVIMIMDIREIVVS